MAPPLQRAAFAAFLAAHPIGVAAVVGATSANAIAYNLVHSLMIQRTSAVATTVLGEVKVLALLALSAGLLGERLGGGVGREHAVGAGAGRRGWRCHAARRGLRVASGAVSNRSNRHPVAPHPKPHPTPARLHPTLN